jgi:hypothetical protein
MLLAPGWKSSFRSQREIIEIGRQLREEDYQRYPLLPEAIGVYQQLASSREWRIITTKTNARGAGRAIDYINNAKSVNYHDERVETGFPQFLRRRALDYLTIGRTLAYWNTGEPLEYLDPAYCHFYKDQDREWHYFLNKRYPESQVWVHHPLPIGGWGLFTSPLSSIIPTAMLAWLIREHDLASADGRKIRDIMAVGSKKAAEDMARVIEEMIEIWEKPITDSNQVPVIYIETMGQVPVKDMFHRLGIANIPEDFNRERFDFYYANQIAAALGLALRHFWSKDEFTNRSLEEINEQRQAVKGPNIFIRSEQEMINRSGMLRQFGPNLRFEFIEEVDVATRKARADVLLSFSQAVKNLLEVGDPSFTMEMALAWGRYEGIMPPDLESIVNQSIQEGEGLKSANLDYGEIAYNQDGFAVEARNRVFHITHAIADDMRHEKNVDEVDVLEESRRFNAEQFLEKSVGDLEAIEFAQKVRNSYGDLTDEEHYAIYNYVFNTED